jgi:hypothetical protein
MKGRSTALPPSAPGEVTPAVSLPDVPDGMETRRESHIRQSWILAKF